MQQIHPVKIGDKLVGPGHPVFFIAEAGVNHDGDIEKAKKLIDVAVEAGADCVKFQSFKTDKLLIQSLPKAEYQKVGDGTEGNYAEMIRRLELNEEMHVELFNYCNEKGIMFLSTPFDNESTDLLDRLGVKAFKIDSGNLNHPQHLKYIASKGKPIILSTGMATIGEVDEAVKTIYSTGNRQLVMMHCTSNYPPSPADVNLRAMKTLRYQFNIPVGYSDHTPGLPVTLAAVGHGACIIEKHFTLDRNARGPDHLASLLPDEVIALVKGFKMIDQAMGSSTKQPVEAEKETSEKLRRSIVTLGPISKGTVITKEMVAIKRPGNGIAPKYLDLVIGRTAQQDIPADSTVRWDQI